MAINNINACYHIVTIDKYVVMPNHVHMIMLLSNNAKANGRTMFAPTVSQIVKQTKEYITKQIGFSIWQKSFYDHIIRNEQDYREIWEHIESNPAKWENDINFEK